MLQDLPGLGEHVYGPLGSFYSRKPETALLKEESTPPSGESARLGASPPEVIHQYQPSSSGFKLVLLTSKSGP